MFKVGDKVWNIKDKCIDTIKQVMYESYVLESDIRFTVKEQDLHQTADAMFEALGYQIGIQENENKYYNGNSTLTFSDKHLWTNTNIISIDLHLAIHQKMIELGLIE